MFTLSFKLSNAVPALLSVFSNRKRLPASTEPTPHTTRTSPLEAKSVHSPARARVSVHEIVARFNSEQPGPTGAMPASTVSFVGIPTRRSAKSRATAMDVAAMFDEPHACKPSSVRGSEVKNALSRIITNANRESSLSQQRSG